MPITNEIDTEPQAPAEPQTPQAPIGSPPPVVIRDEAPDTDDDVEGQAASGEQQPKKPGSNGTRKERRTLMRENQRLAEEVRRSAKAIEDMKTTVQRQLDDIRRSAVQPQQQRAEPQTDPLDAEIAAAKKTMALAYQALRADPNDERAAQAWTESQEKLYDLAGRRGARNEMRQRESQQRRMPQRDATADALRAARYSKLVEAYPWMEDPERGESLTAMVGDAYRMLLRGGRRDSDATHMEAAALVARQMGLGSRVPHRPDERQARARHGFGGGERGNGRVPREVQVDPRMHQGLDLPEHLIRRAHFGYGGDDDS